MMNIVIEGMAKATGELIKRQVIKGLVYGSCTAIGSICVTEIWKGILRKEQEKVLKEVEED